MRCYGYITYNVALEKVSITVNANLLLGPLI